jgi:hypothetical protein
MYIISRLKRSSMHFINEINNRPPNWSGNKYQKEKKTNWESNYKMRDGKDHSSKPQIWIIDPASEISHENTDCGNHKDPFNYFFRYNTHFKGM